jgi:hypothetical protein
MSEYRLKVIPGNHTDHPEYSFGNKAYQLLMSAAMHKNLSSLTVANREFLRRYPDNVATDGRSKTEHIKEIRAGLLDQAFQSLWPTGRFVPGPNNMVSGGALVFPDEADFIMFKLTHL